MIILNSVYAGHKLILDTCDNDTAFRVVCNGCVYALFQANTDPSFSLKIANDVYRMLLENSLKYPKDV